MVWLGILLFIILLGSLIGFIHILFRAGRWLVGLLQDEEPGPLRAPLQQEQGDTSSGPISSFRLLAAAALIDGSVSAAEKQTLLRQAERLGLYSDEATRLLKETASEGRVTILPPGDAVGKRELISAVREVMAADGEPGPEEEAFLDRIRKAFGMPSVPASTASSGGAVETRALLDRLLADRPGDGSWEPVLAHYREQLEAEPEEATAPAVSEEAPGREAAATVSETTAPEAVEESTEEEAPDRAEELAPSPVAAGEAEGKTGVGIRPEEQPDAEAAPTVEEEELTWPEVLIRALLYVGVFGLGTALFTLLYSYREALSGGFKFALVVGFTAGVHVLGHLLWRRFDYPRTGLSFIVLSAILLPLNYFAAKVFGLAPPDHTLLEWGLVGLGCTGVYLAINLWVEDPALPFLVALAGLLSLSALVSHFSLPWVWRGTGAALVSALGIAVAPLVWERQRLPLQLASSLAGLLAVGIYFTMVPAGLGERGPGLWEVALLGFSLFPLAQMIDLRVGSLPARFVPPALLAVNSLIFLKEFSTGRINYTGIFFAVAFALQGYAHLLSRGVPSWLGLLGPAELDNEQRGTEMEEAARLVSDLLGGGAVLFGGFSAMVHAWEWGGTSLFARGGPFTVLGGLLVGIGFAVYRMRRVPGWTVGLSVLGAGFFLYLGEGLASGLDGGAFGVALWAGCCFGFGLYELSRFRSEGEAADDEEDPAPEGKELPWRRRAAERLLASGTTILIVASALHLVYRTFVETAHVPAIGMALLVTGFCFALAWLEPPEVQRPRLAMAAALVGWGFVIGHIWMWEHLVGWTWALPPLALGACGLVVAELGRMYHREEAARGAMGVALVAALIGLLGLGVELIIATGAVNRASVPRSIWASIGLAMVFFGYEAVRTKRRLAAYVAVSLLPASVFYGCLLLKLPWSSMTFHLLGQGVAALLVLGSLAGRRYREEFESPLRRVGLVVAGLSLLGRVVSFGGNWALGSMAVSFLAAGVAALAGRIARNAWYYQVAIAVSILGYFFLLGHLDAGQALYYSLAPGLWGLGAGLWARLKDRSTPLSAAHRRRIAAGLLLLFAPPTLQSFIPGEALAAFLLAAAALGVLGLSFRVRVKRLFTVALVVLVLDFCIQLLHWVDFAAIPKWIWIAVVSSICIFIGFMSERRFKKTVTGGVGKFRDQMETFFEGWE